MLQMSSCCHHFLLLEFNLHLLMQQVAGLTVVIHTCQVQVNKQQYYLNLMKMIKPCVIEPQGTIFKVILIYISSYEVYHTLFNGFQVYVSAK